MRRRSRILKAEAINEGDEAQDIVPHLDEELTKQMLKKEWLPPESAKPLRD
jgi:hypothetical protein